MSLDFALRLIGMMLFALLGALLGINLSDVLYLPPEATGLIFSLMGALAGLIISPWLTTYPAKRARRIITQMPAETLVTIIVGLLLGMLVSAMFAWPLSLLPDPFGQVLPTLAAIVITYITMMIFSIRAPDVFALFGGLLRGNPSALRMMSGGGSISGEILLDTSVIIDGRILDISRTGFIQSALVIPRFVLNELQHVADSAEMLRRNRGKRGLEILSELQQHSQTPVRIIDDDVVGTDEVDEKLVLLARQRNIPVMTNDFNLNRVAELQGVSVLNINELSNALKAIFLPGEVIDIHVVLEGREADQGVGYLEDGTMVVVEDGKRYMDRTIPVLITRYIVTNAGRMYFAQPEGSLRR
ncbi:MAG: PIN domain nuclease [Chloroflexi bacterium]|nr:PIN domain nuclease [Chloroflexota bacterium]